MYQTSRISISILYAGTHCFHQLTVEAAASCEVHLLHCNCNGHKASCSMEELMACRSPSRGLQTQTCKGQWRNTQPLLTGLPDLEWHPGPGTCGFSLVMKASSGAEAAVGINSWLPHPLEAALSSVYCHTWMLHGNMGSLMGCWLS
jgi:hypothetical protein